MHGTFTFELWSEAPVMAYIVLAVGFVFMGLDGGGAAGSLQILRPMRFFTSV